MYGIVMRGFVVRPAPALGIAPRFTGIDPWLGYDNMVEKVLRDIVEAVRRLLRPAQGRLVPVPVRVRDQDPRPRR